MPNYSEREPQDPMTQAMCTLCAEETEFEDLHIDIGSMTCWCGRCHSEAAYLNAAESRRSILKEIYGEVTSNIQIGQ